MSCPWSCCGLVRGETGLQEKHLHSFLPPPLSTFCTITTARQESACFVHGDGTRCSQHNSSKYKETFDDFLYTALPFLFRLPLLLSPCHHLPTSSLPSQIPASIFLACVKLSDKKEFGLNDFIEKEIQYKDCWEKSFVVVIRYYKIYFMVK